MRSLKLADSWGFESYCSHFCVTNPSKLSKKLAQPDNLKSINLPQLLRREISTSLLQFTRTFTIKSLPFAMRLFDKQCPDPSPNSCHICKSDGVEAHNFNQNVAYIFTAHTSCIRRAQEKTVTSFHRGLSV